MFSDICMALTCTYCHAGPGQPCRTSRGRLAPIPHSARYRAALAAARILALAWEEGHESCGHSCHQYEGLGEPCHNPYAVAS